MMNVIKIVKRLMGVMGIAGLLLVIPQSATAESSSCNTSGCTTNANVNFRVVVPTFLRLRVGAAAATDLIEFQPGAANVGDSTPISATAGSGDQGTGQSTAQVVSNFGAAVNMTVGVTGTGSGIACTAGSCTPGTDFVNWNEISTATTGTVTPPALDNAGAGTAVYTPTGNIINENDTWTFTYDNTAIPVAGTYNGTVTYTVTAP